MSRLLQLQLSIRGLGGSKYKLCALPQIIENVKGILYTYDNNDNIKLFEFSSFLCMAEKSDRKVIRVYRWCPGFVVSRMKVQYRSPSFGRINRLSGNVIIGIGKRIRHGRRVNGAGNRAGNNRLVAGHFSFPFYPIYARDSPAGKAGDQTASE